MSLIDERALELLVARATRTAVAELLTPLVSQERPELLHLVAMPEIAEVLDCSIDHVGRLIDAGEMGEVFDIRAPGSRRAARRVSREALSAYLDRHREATRLRSAS